MKTAKSLISFVQESLAEVADPINAPQMAAYMKTSMPFYGVKKPLRKPITRAIKKQFRPANRQAYERAVRGLWKLPHREEKYIALAVARMFPGYIDGESMPLFEQLIRQGAWWDFVDEVAVQLVGPVLLNERKATKPMMDEWINDDDMWIRRSAIISHIKHKQATDHRSLFRYCRERADEKEFFIRKAIGWALREYSKTDPARVRTFLHKYETCLSGLSYREGARILQKRGLLNV